MGSTHDSVHPTSPVGSFWPSHNLLFPYIIQPVLPETYYSSVTTLQGGSKVLWNVSKIANKHGIISHKTVIFINSAVKMSSHMTLLVCKMGYNYGNVE
jgi:hypothetical protein